jgi:hypothetical protein
MTRIPSFFLVLIALAVSLPSAVHAREVTMDFLRGQWTLEKTEYTEPVQAMEYFPPEPSDNLWIFSGDSLMRYNYPYTFLEGVNVRIDSGRLFKPSGRHPVAFLRSDSGKLVAKYTWFTLTFRRDTLPEKMLSCVRLLQRDTINPGKLIATFTMITHFEPDDEAAFDFELPVKMAKTISLPDSAHVRAAVRSDILYITTDGRQRPFHLVSVQWERASYTVHDTEQMVLVPVIIVTPGDWWTGEAFQVLYRADAKEIAKQK